ncbi:hypothetical protein RQM47_05585 [Rubrivirga sp. S365]|uniref:hypothetical protein n=1 Tax=Rubrivirga sp. S365 TaxID=3076080 RepID=UPI0028C673F1|nr:hypothetical protein [Rubrivirga sp. S365]MDT7856105.1 hypothetical protein [Rubrivirga sp. S365]
MSTLGWFLLLLVAAAVAWVVLRGRRATPPPRPALGRDDLTSLGLSEVRAREPGASPVRESSASPARAAAPPRPGPARPAPAAAPPALARPSGPVADGEVSPDATLWPDGAEPARHLLAALAAHAGGAAGVLRYDAEADAYVAEAAAGARLPEPLPADRCPLHRAPQDGELTLLDEPSGMGPFTGDVLVRALAAPPAARAFLVVAPAHADAAVGQVGPFADLLAGLSDLAPAAPPVPARPSRAAVIREEQEAAEVEGRPLAFALVTLADAEEILAREAPDEVAEAEAGLRRRLADHPAVRRTEPFGDLLVGAFLDLDPDGVAAWCESTSASAPAVFIGAVAPVDGDAADVRAAAADALHDAYEQQRAQVVAG